MFGPRQHQKQKSRCWVGSMAVGLEVVAAECPFTMEQPWRKKESCLCASITALAFLDSWRTRSSAKSRGEMLPEITGCRTRLRHCNGCGRILLPLVVIRQT